MISIEAYRAAIGSVNRKSRFRGKTLHSNGFDNALVLIVMMLLSILLYAIIAATLIVFYTFVLYSLSFLILYGFVFQ